MPRASAAAVLGPGWAMGPPTSAPLLLHGANLAKFGCEGPALCCGSGNEPAEQHHSDFTQQPCPLKHQRGQVSTETPPKHEHIQPIPWPGNRAAKPSVPGKRLRAAGIAAGKGKTSGSRARCSDSCLSPGNTTAAEHSLQARCTGRASVPVLQCPLRFLAMPRQGARPGAVAG